MSLIEDHFKLHRQPFPRTADSTALMPIRARTYGFRDHQIALIFLLFAASKRLRRAMQIVGLGGADGGRARNSLARFRNRVSGSQDRAKPR